jgi:uncharacterized membrane protein (DUF441 family)
MKDILQTTAVITAIAASIVIAIMAPKGFQLGPQNPIVATSEMNQAETQ